MSGRGRWTRRRQRWSVHGVLIIQSIGTHPNFYPPEPLEFSLVRSAAWHRNRRPGTSHYILLLLLRFILRGSCDWMGKEGLSLLTHPLDAPLRWSVVESSSLVAMRCHTNGLMFLRNTQVAPDKKLVGVWLMRCRPATAMRCDDDDKVNRKV